MRNVSLKTHFIRDFPSTNIMPFLISRLSRKAGHSSNKTVQHLMNEHLCEWPQPERHIGGSCHKYHFCHDKSFVMTNMCLSWQNTSFVTRVCLLWQKFSCEKLCLSRKKIIITTNIGSHQLDAPHAYFCHNKHGFVMTKHVFCLNKSMLVEKKLLSQETCVCCDKYLSR